MLTMRDAAIYTVLTVFCGANMLRLTRFDKMCSSAFGAQIADWTSSDYGNFPFAAESHLR